MKAGQKRRKYVITEDMVEDTDLEEEEEIMEVDSDNASQHSAQEVVTRVNVRDSITSGNPQFEVEMRKTSTSYPFQMHIPMKFVKHHLPSFTTYITIRNIKGKKWRVQFNYTSRRCCFSNGWKAFAIVHSLKIGDCCRFELVDKYEILCHIYRDLSQKRSPETRPRGQIIYEESSKREKKEKLAAEVPSASRCVAKRKSPRYASDQTESVDSLLQSMGLEKYSDIFHAEEIDIAALKLMTDEDLKFMAIPMGPRKKILDALKSST
ncbi:Mitogen-activated protein kinase kinase kinase [Thalictrum thalictroides]|uniref:Mitogen-activated protein kinase kinase kinase n=1 Tax=Thalictrum thalictroides TaxID=46969 RepID=A0A7J6W3J6_THATH|nr:Mitogen-activated protein kinase kinase kinase [Thalictrum thalictroides]